MSISYAPFTRRLRTLTKRLAVVVAASLLLQAPASSAGEPPFSSIPSPEPVIAGWGMWQPSPVAPHLVLRPHRQPSWGEPSGGHHASRAADHHHHPRHDGHHRPEHVAGARAAVPEAETIYRKKVPYSYGYFGARENRHWSLHHGHQQDRIEWVLR